MYDPSKKWFSIFPRSKDPSVYDPSKKSPRSKDPSVYDPSKKWFSSKDLIAERRRTSDKSSEKKTTYQDVVRRTLLEGGATAFDDEEERLEEVERRRNKSFGLNHLDAATENELDAIKSAINAEAGKIGGNGAGQSGGEDEDGDSFLVEKNGDDPDEDENEKKLVEEARHKLDRGKKRKRDVLAEKYWSGGELTKEEFFLREYVLNEGWRDAATSSTSAVAHKDGGSGGDHTGVQGGKAKTADTKKKRKTDAENRASDGDGNSSSDGDSESEFDWAADDYERTYNFRFEEENGSAIGTFARTNANSVRAPVPSARAKQRAAKSAGKKQDTIRKSEELNRLRALKQKELARRAKQIAGVSGGNLLWVDEMDETDEQYLLKQYGELLEGDYEAEGFDRKMEKCLGLGAGYYEEAENVPDEELLAAVRGENEDNAWADGDVDVAEMAVERGGEEGAEWEDPDQEGQEPDQWGDDPEQNGQESAPDLWFLCDACEKPIKPGKNFYESDKREDYILCQKCWKNADKTNDKFRRCKVPNHAEAPKDWQQCLTELGPREGPGDDCSEQDEEEHGADHHQTTPSLGDSIPDDDSLLAAGLKIHPKYLNGPKFQYFTLPDEGYKKGRERKKSSSGGGLSVADILSKDDKTLNRFTPLKKVTRPYALISDYRDERMEKYEQAKKAEKKSKRKKLVKTGIRKERLDAYKSKRVILKGAAKK